MADGQFKAVVPTGAPFAMELPLTVSEWKHQWWRDEYHDNCWQLWKVGTFTVTRTPGTTASVTVDITTLPELPTHTNAIGDKLHQGYTLVKSTDLPLEVIGGINNAPVFTDGTTTTRSVPENTAANTNIGPAVSATDTDNDTLTYTLGGTDAAAFSIVSTTGQLQTNAALRL